MTEKEFMTFMGAFTPNDQGYLLGLFVKNNEQARNELYDYIKKNNLNCDHLFCHESDDWEESYNDWEKLNDKLTEIEDKYGL